MLHGLDNGCRFAAPFRAFIAVDRQLNADQEMSLGETYEHKFAAPLVPVQTRERTTTTSVNDQSTEVGLQSMLDRTTLRVVEANSIATNSTGLRAI